MPTGWNYSEALCQIELWWVNEVEYGSNVLITCHQSLGVDKAKDKPNWIERNEMPIIIALMIISLFIIIYFIAPGMLGIAKTNVASVNASEFNVVITSEGNPMGMSECLSNNGLNESRIIYIYSDNCMYAQSNTPWVIDLNNNGYDIYMANTNDPETMNVVTSCLSRVAQLSGTPEFICPAKNESVLGPFNSETDLKEFVNSCK